MMEVKVTKTIKFKEYYYPTEEIIRGLYAQDNIDVQEIRLEKNENNCILTWSHPSLDQALAKLPDIWLMKITVTEEPRGR